MRTNRATYGRWARGLLQGLGHLVDDDLFAGNRAGRNL